MWEMAWVGPALLMSRTPSSTHGGCDPARSTTGHTHTMACAFYEDFSDLALFAASPAALLWARRTQAPPPVVYTGSRSAAVTPYGPGSTLPPPVFSPMARTRLTGMVRPAGRCSSGGPRGRGSLRPLGEVLLQTHE